MATLSGHISLMEQVFSIFSMCCVGPTHPRFSTTSLGSGGQACGLAIGDLVNDGNAQIQAVELDGAPRPCADLTKHLCTAGLTGNACANNAQCDSFVAADDGVCTAVGAVQLAHENPSDGVLDTQVDTTGFGGSVLGFRSSYEGGGKFENAPVICTDLIVEEVACSGATISIDLASGPGEPAAPGGPYDWSFRVTVHACEDLLDVSAQGGTNGWAQLVDRANPSTSLDPSGSTTAEIRKGNKKTDVILWTIGPMTAGQTETLVVDLTGSIKGAPDCQERFLSGPWSALFSADGVTIDKTDYTGRVSVFTNSNGTEGDCF